MLTASFISTMIGTKFPGTGSLWCEQQIRFLSPVRIGGKIRVWAKVRHKSFAQRILVLETIVFDAHRKRVIEGEAKVKILKQEKKKPTMFDQNKGANIVSGTSRGIGASIAKAPHGAINLWVRKVVLKAGYKLGGDSRFGVNKDA